MAITKIHPIKTGISNSLNYIMSKEKTTIYLVPLEDIKKGQMELKSRLVSTFACSSISASDDFKRVANDPRSSHRSVIGQHLIQSFKPGEVSIEHAHEIGKKLADQFLEGRFQYVMATHIDKEHIHNHIIFNNVSYKSYDTFQSKRKNIYKIREISDELCREYGLSVIELEDKSNQRKDPSYSQGQYKNSYRNIIKSDIDLTIPKSTDFKDFLDKMTDLGYEVNRDKKHITLRHRTNGQKRNIRLEGLGSGYSKSMINYRINNEFVDIKKHEFQPLRKDWVKKVIDITSDDKFQTEPGLRHWVVRQNNQAMIATLNRMNQLGCGSYIQMVNYVKQLDNLYENDTKQIKELSVEINDLKNILSRSESLLEQLNLYEHAMALPEDDRADFINEKHVNPNIKNKFMEFQNELFFEGFTIETIDDLREITIKIEKELEVKRTDTRKLLADQEIIGGLTDEMKYLANNYDRFIEKEPRYPEERRNTKKYKGIERF